MALSVFDLFKVGIGPSSSHTVGPMKAALAFAEALQAAGVLADCERLRVELFGSLGATGAGHGSPKAIILGLAGEAPETVAVEGIAARVAKVREESRLPLLGGKTIPFSYRDDLVMHRRKRLAYHPNGMKFAAFAKGGALLLEKAFYSVGGGFIVDEAAAEGDALIEDPTPCPIPSARPRNC